MNYSFYIIALLSILGAIFIPLMFWNQMRIDFFSKMIAKKLMQLDLDFFASEVIRNAVKIAIKYRQKDIISFLLDGQIIKAAKIIKKHNTLWATLMLAFLNPRESAQKLQIMLKKNPQNSQLSAYLALLFEAMGEKTKIQVAWDNVNEKKLSPYLRAFYWLNIAEIALKNGDLEFATKQFYKAASLLNKTEAFFEEADIYIKLGTIYRICFIDDVAETLFLSALRTFKLLKYQNGIAKVYANLGMLMIGEERFNEAENYLLKSLDIYDTNKLMINIAEIYNQLALLFILQKKFTEATKYLNKAKTIHTKENNTNGIAFSLELFANNLWEQDKYSEVIKKANSAIKLYKKCNNISGLLETSYLLAQALFKQGDDIAAENTLRDIIKIGKNECGCFYLANAYNLLGIVYIKRNDLRRAKGLFQQSLDLEQRGVRSKAIATDYANLGLLEMRCGHKDCAEKNLQMAMKFAQDIEDTQMIEWLQGQLCKINN